MKRSYSIIICTLNRAAFLPNAIDAARRVRWNDVEIIVVNGPSTDNTEEVVRRFTDVKLLHCPKANLSMSRNVGIAAARGDIVAFLDDDSLPEPTWIERLDTVYDNPLVGGVGGYIIDHTGVSYQCKAVVCDRFGDSMSFDTVEEALSAQDQGRTTFLSQTGANSTFRRDALLGIGGFDETFTYFLDETDVNLRLTNAGWRIEYAPEALVHHKYAPSAERDHRRVPKSLYAPVRSKAYFAIVHNRGRISLETIFDHLVDHALTLRWHNGNLLNEGLIDSAQYSNLESDVVRGLKDGVARALTMPEPELLDERKLDRFRDHAFTPLKAPIPLQKRLRIAFASREYPPQPAGGIGVWTEVLARQLAEEGHEVSVVSLAESNHTVDFQNGVWVHRIVPTYSPQRTVPALPDLPQSVKDYAYAVHDEIMRIHGVRGLDLFSWPIWDLEGIAVAASGTIPTVLSLHTTYALAKPHKPDWTSSPEYISNHVDKVIEAERSMLLSAPNVLANSRSVLNDIERAYGISMRRSGVVLIPHGIRPASQAAVVELSANLAESATDEIRVLFVGRLEPRKGAEVLIRALPICFAAARNLRVDFVGAGLKNSMGATMEEEFKARYGGEPWSERVHFRGEIDRETLESAFASCDLFVGPSRYESFGLVFLEAMKYGKPCIGTNVGGIAEVVGHEETGLLVPPGDASALADAIIELARDSAKRHRLGLAAKHRFGLEFTAKIQAKRAVHFYRSILAKDRSPGANDPLPENSRVWNWKIPG